MPSCRGCVEPAREKLLSPKPPLAGIVPSPPTAGDGNVAVRARPSG